MKSFITDNDDLKAMVSALRQAGAPLESTRTTHRLRGHGGDIVFQAMRGSRKVGGTWLVSHHPNLFRAA
jgi:uncharacterized protein with von Willebrand factor type A (vWA) domain